jgi:hypothetical protein
VASLFPGFAPPEDHNALAYAGAAGVVAGSALVALGPLLGSRRSDVRGAPQPDAEQDRGPRAA